jgi:hypothetical protein
MKGIGSKTSNTVIVENGFVSLAIFGRSALTGLSGVVSQAIRTALDKLAEQAACVREGVAKRRRTRS